MWVEIFSALFTVLSALIVGIALYHRENAVRIRFAIFIAAIPVVNFILNISLPHYISVGAFVLATTVLCKLILNENKITSLASAMIIAFFHRVMMLVYFSAVYIFAREYFTYGLRCFYSMMYAMVFLNILINAKLNGAMSGGIKVEITIFSEVDITSVPTLDLCRIIGNLLDNAVEAASVSDNKVISLVMPKNDNQYSITLCNGFSGEIDMSRIWKKGYSSKGKNRGQGLSIVKKLIDAHPEILINTEIKNNLFVQDLTIIK